MPIGAILGNIIIAYGIIWEILGIVYRGPKRVIVKAMEGAFVIAEPPIIVSPSGNEFLSQRYGIGRAIRD